MLERRGRVGEGLAVIEAGLGLCPDMFSLRLRAVDLAFAIDEPACVRHHLEPLIDDYPLHRDVGKPIARAEVAAGRIASAPRLWGAYGVSEPTVSGTPVRMIRRDDVPLYVTADAFDGFGGTRWYNHLLKAHGCGHWRPTVDADEFLAYPGAERLTLRQLAEHLDAQGAEAMRAFMLDMYPGIIQAPHLPTQGQACRNDRTSSGRLLGAWR